MSYIDRKRYDYEPKPMVQTRSSRWSFLGVSLFLLATPLARSAKAHGWVVNETAAQVIVGVIGLGCILGAWIAYGAAQKQVARDMEDVGRAGRIDR